MAGLGSVADLERFGLERFHCTCVHTVYNVLFVHFCRILY